MDSHSPESLKSKPRSPSSQGAYGEELKAAGSNIIYQDMATKKARIDIPDELATRAVYKLSHHILFRSGVNIIIMVNAIQMGFAADWKGDPWDQVWLVFDHIFTAVFAVEMVIQLIALRMYYFKDPWNHLDFTIANIAIIDTWILPLVQDQKSSLGAFKVFRLLRLLRMLKVMHMIPELMTVVEGLMSSIKSMFWIFMLLVIVLYSAGICCVEVIGNQAGGYPGRTENIPDIRANVVDSFNTYLYFGSVIRSMVSLLNVVLMADWNTVIRPVFEVQSYMIAFFVLLALLCSFGLFNVIIGVVVERTTEAMDEHKSNMLNQEKSGQMNQTKLLADYMFSLDTDGNDRICISEMEKAGENPDLISMLRQIDLPNDFTFLELFQMLDTNGDGTLTRQEFVGGVMRLIYNSEFHRDCLACLALGQIKRKNVISTEAIHVKIDEMRKEVRRDITTLREEILHALKQGPARSVTGLSSSAHVTAPSTTTAVALPEMPTGSTWEPVPFQTNAAVRMQKNLHGVDSGAVGQKADVPPHDRSTDEVNGAEPNSIWEPLQTSIIPVKFMTSNPHLGRELSSSLPLRALESSEQRVLGFLPVVGSIVKSEVHGICALGASGSFDRYSL